MAGNSPAFRLSPASASYALEITFEDWDRTAPQRLVIVIHGDVMALDVAALVDVAGELEPEGELAGRIARHRERHRRKSVSEDRVPIANEGTSIVSEGGVIGDRVRVS